MQCISSEYNMGNQMCTSLTPVCRLWCREHETDPGSDQRSTHRSDHQDQWTQQTASPSEGSDRAAEERQHGQTDQNHCCSTQSTCCWANWLIESWTCWSSWSCLEGAAESEQQDWLKPAAAATLRRFPQESRAGQSLYWCPVREEN